MAVIGVGLGAALSSYFNRQVAPTLSGILIGLTMGCMLLFAYAWSGGRAQQLSRDIDYWKWDQLGAVFRDMKGLDAEQVKRNILVLDRDFTNAFYDDARFDRMIEQLRGAIMPDP